MENKMEGSYYTPYATVEFMYRYFFEQKQEVKSLLEPSAGDGRFIDIFCKKADIDKIVGVEINENKAEQLKSKNYPKNVEIITSDFLAASSTFQKMFQLVIGNPPYINIKNMSKNGIAAGKTLCRRLNISESVFKNTWVAFVLASVKLLTKDGAIFFVLPMEFLQVQYAEKLRGFLEKKFNTIHILTFAERMFPEIEQEACLVYMTNEPEALPYILYRHYDKLNSMYFSYESKIQRNKPLKKWTNAILFDQDIDLLKKVINRCEQIKNISDSAPGIVTGANAKFILTKKEVVAYNCEELVVPVISKGIMAKNSYEINNELVEKLAEKGQKVFLLNLASIALSDMPESLVTYLSQFGDEERNGIKIRDSYKCSRRSPWYAVPLVAPGEVVFFKRYGSYPRFSTNPDNIYTTDIAYNLKLKKGVSPESLVFCFYNSVTLTQCEVVGRYYAGGVSELTPNEFRSLVVPYKAIALEDIQELKEMFNANEKPHVILDFVDSRTLTTIASGEEISQLRIIREKLIRRRIHR